MSPTWGNYENAVQASGCLIRFTDAVLGPACGIAWMVEGRLYAIRAPIFDADGQGELCTFEFSPRPTPAPSEAVGVATRIEQWIEGVLDAQGRSAIAQSEASLAEGQLVAEWLSPALNQYRLDTVGVGMDAVGVALSIGLLATGGIEVLGFIALLGAFGLLVADGYAYGLELTGDTERAENFKDLTFPFRVLATIALLPDAAWSIGKVLADVREMGEAVAHSTSTAKRGFADASRSSGPAGQAEPARQATAGYAARYTEIAARAQRKASVGRAKLRTFIAAQAVSRTLIPPGAYLLFDEVREDRSGDDRGRLRDLLTHLRFHVSVIHRIQK